MMDRDKRVLLRLAPTDAREAEPGAGGETSPSAPEKANFFGMLNSGDLFEYGDETRVIDMATLRMPERLPLLLNHNIGQIIGWFEPRKEIGADGGVSLVGYGAYMGAKGEEIKNLSKAGVPIQMSVAIMVGEYREIKDGEELSVNGRKRTGPFVVMSNCEAYEATVTPTGADSRTWTMAFAREGELMDTANEAAELRRSLKAAKEETAALQDALGKERAETKRLAEELEGMRLERIAETLAAKGYRFAKGPASAPEGMKQEAYEAICASAGWRDLIDALKQGPAPAEEARRKMPETLTKPQSLEPSEPPAETSRLFFSRKQQRGEGK